jgi:hypothetical protein
MHIAEALMPKEEAVRLAADELRAILSRNGRYYDALPGLRPDPDRPLIDAVRADDTWYFIPFARTDAKALPVLMRVNGVTRAISMERKF